MDYQLETMVIHADADVTSEKGVAPAIHYSAVFKAEDSDTAFTTEAAIAEMPED